MENCIFCKIAKHEIPKEFIYESEAVMAFDDINPEAPTHTLILPKKHIRDLNELTLEDKDTLAEIFMAIQEVASKKGVKEDGYRIIINTGKNSGQLIDHLHVHLLGGKNLGPKLIR